METDHDLNFMEHPQKRPAANPCRSVCTLPHSALWVFAGKTGQWSGPWLWGGRGTRGKDLVRVALLWEAEVWQVRTKVCGSRSKQEGSPDKVSLEEIWQISGEEKLPEWAKCRSKRWLRGRSWGGAWEGPAWSYKEYQVCPEKYRRRILHWTSHL